MGRGRSTTLDDLAGLPWPVPLALGAAAYVGIRHGLPAWLSGRGPVFDGLAQRPDTVASFAWLVLAACTLAALVSFLRARQRRRLLDSRTDLDSIAVLGWRDFERLVGEAFRRQRYHVEETGLGGADGGIDLILSRGGRRTLVQCKQWRRRQVPVSVVREMYGLLAHHGAHAVRIAALGGFTRCRTLRRRQADRTDRRPRTARAGAQRAERRPGARARHAACRTRAGNLPRQRSHAPMPALRNGHGATREPPQRQPLLGLSRLSAMPRNAVI